MVSPTVSWSRDRDFIRCYHIFFFIKDQNVYFVNTVKFFDVVYICKYRLKVGNIIIIYFVKILNIIFKCPLLYNNIICNLLNIYKWIYIYIGIWKYNTYNLLKVDKFKNEVIMKKSNRAIA